MSEYNLPIKIQVPGKENKRMWHSQPDLENVINWINDKNLDPYTTSELIKKAKKHPPGAYEQFRKNFNNYVQAIQKNKNSDS